MSIIRIAAATAAFLTAFGANAAPDWNAVKPRNISVFHPATATFDWTMTKGTHSGVRGMTSKGERCSGCHEDQGQLNFDFLRLRDPALEPVGAPKTMQFPVAVQAAYDAENLYIRLRFKAPADAAEAAPREDKSPKHEVKAAVMLIGDKVTMGNQVGCWATCHSDVRSMPGADKDKKKYVKGADVAGGVFTDYIQWTSGEAGQGAMFLDGHVAQARVNKDGQALVKAEGAMDGDHTVVTFTRKLTGGAGDVALAEGKVVPFGIAIHADRVVWRFHHVSLDYTLGLGVDADVKAVKF